MPGYSEIRHEQLGLRMVGEVPPRCRVNFFGEVLGEMGRVEIRAEAARDLHEPERGDRENFTSVRAVGSQGMQLGHWLRGVIAGSCDEVLDLVTSLRAFMEYEITIL